MSPNSLSLIKPHFSWSQKELEQSRAALTWNTISPLLSFTENCCLTIRTEWLLVWMTVLLWISLHHRHTAGCQSEVCTGNHRGSAGSVCNRGDLCRLQWWQRLHGIAPSVLRSPETVTGRRRCAEKIRINWFNQGKISDLREKTIDL